MNSVLSQCPGSRTVYSNVSKQIMWNTNNKWTAEGEGLQLYI